MRRDNEGNELDDPAGGVLDGAADRLSLGRTRRTRRAADEETVIEEVGAYP